MKSVTIVTNLGWIDVFDIKSRNLINFINVHKMKI